MNITKWYKTIAEIRRKARAKERRKVEKQYLAELDRQRKEHIQSLNDLKSKMEKEKEDVIKKTENRLGVEINRLKLTIVELKDQIEQARKAWRCYKDFVPEVLSLAEKFKTITFVEQQRVIEKQRTAEMIEDRFEIINSELIKVTPKIEELLRIE